MCFTGLRGGWFSGKICDIICQLFPKYYWVSGVFCSADENVSLENLCQIAGAGEVRVFWPQNLPMFTDLEPLFSIIIIFSKNSNIFPTTESSMTRVAAFASGSLTARQASPNRIVVSFRPVLGRVQPLLLSQPLLLGQLLQILRRVPVCLLGVDV